MTESLFAKPRGISITRQSMAVRSASDKAFEQVLREIEGDRPTSVGREVVLKTIVSSLTKQSQDSPEARIQVVNSVLDCLLLHYRGAQVLPLIRPMWGRRRYRELRRTLAIEHACNMTIHELTLLRLEFHESRPGKDSEADVIFAADAELNLD
ncbi:MAG TPA: hypothetical protein VMR75_00230 [Candidatus Saccharimonadales bacterium]|nr:hypothetical protein [Candidatus Saccharimonadales bacterium]